MFSLTPTHGWMERFSNETYIIDAIYEIVCPDWKLLSFHYSSSNAYLKVQMIVNLE